jgi:hypothetical protein
VMRTWEAMEGNHSYHMANNVRYSAAARQLLHIVEACAKEAPLRKPVQAKAALAHATDPLPPPHMVWQPLLTSTPPSADAKVICTWFGSVPAGLAPGVQQQQQQQQQQVVAHFEAGPVGLELAHRVDSDFAIYAKDITKGGQAAMMDLACGDVLVAVNGTVVAADMELAAAVALLQKRPCTASFLRCVDTSNKDTAEASWGREYSRLVPPRKVGDLLYAERKARPSDNVPHTRDVAAVIGPVLPHEWVAFLARALQSHTQLALPGTVPARSGFYMSSKLEIRRFEVSEAGAWVPSAISVPALAPALKQLLQEAKSEISGADASPASEVETAGAAEGGDRADGVEVAAAAAAAAGMRSPAAGANLAAAQAVAAMAAVAPTTPAGETAAEEAQVTPSPAPAAVASAESTMDNKLVHKIKHTPQGAGSAAGAELSWA